MFQGMRYVYEVYKEMSFSRAAKNLYISQPSLSTAVKKVEIVPLEVIVRNVSAFPFLTAAPPPSSLPSWGGSISGPPKPCWMWKTAFAAMWTT